MSDSKVEGSAAKRRPPNAGKGRVKGTPNKSTKALKDAILGAFNAVGGEHYLRRVAEEDPKTFCALLGKILPAEIKAEHAGAEGGPLTVVIKRYSDE